MASNPEHDFHLSGPSQLTAVNWIDEHHRRSVAASLVKGVYIQEQDRQNGGEVDLAPPWWESFQFELYKKLIDEKDNSIFGSIYKFKTPTAASAENAPKYVIAFRGTMIQKSSIRQDIENNLKIAINKFHKSARFKAAMEHILNRDYLIEAADGNVWLAGHSQGSATALLVGKRMSKMGFHLKTFLFNPPFISSPLDWIKSPVVNHVARVTESCAKAGLAAVSKRLHKKKRDQDSSFVKSSEWIPNLFVNPRDPICQGYTGYFKHRGSMENVGARDIERVAAQTSIRSLIWYSFGGDSEPFHLIPSADLTINLSESKQSAHALHQWWDHIQTQSDRFTWDVPEIPQSHVDPTLIQPLNSLRIDTSPECSVQQTEEN